MASLNAYYDFFLNDPIIPQRRRRIKTFLQNLLTINLFTHVCMRILISLLIAILLLPKTAGAEELCPPWAPPKITVNKQIAAPRVNDTLSLKEIRAIALDGKKELSSGPHETPVGLTAASLRLSSQFKILARTNPQQKKTCARLTGLDLTLAIIDTTVYMPREIAKGSCPYQIVWDHEQKHVLTDRVMIEQIAPTLYRKLSAIANQVSTETGHSAQEVEAKMHAKLDSHVHKLGQDIAALRREEQSRIDTPEEYKRLSTACKGEMQRIISLARKQGL